MTINLWGKPKKPKAADSCEAPAGLIEALLAAQNGTLTKEMWDRLGPSKPANPQPEAEIWELIAAFMKEMGPHSTGEGSFAIVPCDPSSNKGCSSKMDLGFVIDKDFGYEPFDYTERN